LIHVGFISCFSCNEITKTFEL